MTTDTKTSNALSRRHLLRLAAGGAAALAVAAAVGTAGASSSPEQLAVTGEVDLLNKPRASARVRRALPPKAIVTRLGGGNPRYVKVVTHSGIRGYVDRNYLTEAYSGNPGSSDLPWSRWRTTADVNQRATTDLSSEVYAVILEDTEVGSQGDARDGFVHIYYGLRRGWVSLDYLIAD